jgi:hypothetical protein
MFLNLSSGSLHIAGLGDVKVNQTLSAQRAGFGPNAPGTGGSRTTTQNWVIVSMFAGGGQRLAVDLNAVWLGNGCSVADTPVMAIAPSNQRGGPLVCPNNTTPSNCGTGTLPPLVTP